MFTYERSFAVFIHKYFEVVDIIDRYCSVICKNKPNIFNASSIENDTWNIREQYFGSTMRANRNYSANNFVQIAAVALPRHKHESNSIKF